MRARSLSLGIAVACVAAAASADDKTVDFGKREYQNSCAVCHGADGSGRTQMIDVLTVAPPDLRKLAQRNGGVFPIARIYETIDGRLTLKAHGTRDMPIWGQRFSVEAAPQYDDYPYNAEAHVRARILGVIDYLYRLQEK